MDAAPTAGAPPAYAPYVRRAAAWVVDTLLVVALPTALAVAALAASQGSEDGQPGQTGIGALGALLVPLYSALLHARWHGQTLGKRLLGIRVLRTDGEPLHLVQSFVRSYVRITFLVVFQLPWVLDMLWPLSNPQRRALHDLLAGSVVVLAPPERGVPSPAGG